MREPALLPNLDAQGDVRVWSIQSSAVMEHLTSYGKLSGDLRRVSRLDRHAYSWMLSQYSRRIGTHATQSLVWGWYAYRGKTQRRPDLRKTMHLPRGSRGVLLDLSLDCSTLLLSQFEMWVWVMGGHYVPQDFDELEWVEKSSKRLSRRKLENSWERIFNLSFGSEEFWGPMSLRAIQFVVPEICVNQIRRVTPFVAR